MCNNEQNPWWGAGNIPLARWLSSQYENDFSTPIGWDSDRLYNSFKLPVVRRVSNEVIGTSEVTGKFRSCYLRSSSLLCLNLSEKKVVINKSNLIQIK